jgi:hypothetical protein
MTDDQTRPIEPLRPTEPIPADAAPVTEAPAATDAPTTAGAGATAAPAAATSSAAPIGAVTPLAKGSNRGRWLLALGVAGLAIAITVGALLVLNGPATPEALRYVPADAAVVAEVRLDLPGDQMQHLGNLLAHFPGFKDQASLPDKIDEALTRLIGTASSGQANFRSDLKPWLNGAAFVGVLAPASGATAQKPQAVISATTNGAVTCAATFKDQTVSHESYRGLDLVISADGSMACVVDGRQALLGDPATVKKALDAKAAGTGMDKIEKYRAARAALGGDRLATMFVSGSSVAQMLPLPGASAAIPDLTAVASAIPEWIMVGLRAEDDALVVDTIAAPVALPSSAPSLLPLPSTHPSLINGLVPADTLVLLEHQGAGVSLQNLLTVLRANPQLAAPLQMLDGLGGGGDLFGWIDDVGVAASVHGTKPDVTLLIVARDDAAASSRVAALGTLLGFAGLGDGVQVSASTISGVAVTTIKVTDLASVVPPGTVPGIDQLPVTGPIEFSIAARGRVILVTSGEAAMTAVLNVQPGGSLAEQPSFKLAVQRGLANSRTSVYLAAGASFDLAKTLLPAATVAQWQSDIAPYVDPIDAVGLSVSGDAAAYRSRLVITVSQP